MCGHPEGRACSCVCWRLCTCRYPALQWQLRAARRALAAVAAAGPWLRDRAGATRYAHVPLAGLGKDALMGIADVLMLRRLREAGHVLWAADPALADLGGWLGWCALRGRQPSMIAATQTQPGCIVAVGCLLWLLLMQPILHTHPHWYTGFP